MVNLFDYNPAGPAAAEAGRAQEIARNGTSAAGRGQKGGAGEDRVELSAAAGNVKAVLDGSATARASRVAQLRSAFEAGRYSPDPAAIGRGMVEEALAAGATS